MSSPAQTSKLVGGTKPSSSLASPQSKTSWQHHGTNWEKTTAIYQGAHISDSGSSQPDIASRKIIQLTPQSATPTTPQSTIPTTTPPYTGTHWLSERPTATTTSKSDETPLHKDSTSSLETPVIYIATTPAKTSDSQSSSMPSTATDSVLSVTTSINSAINMSTPKT